MFSVSPRARRMVCYRQGVSVQFGCQMDGCRTNGWKGDKSSVRSTVKFGKDPGKLNCTELLNDKAKTPNPTLVSIQNLFVPNLTQILCLAFYLSINSFVSFLSYFLFFLI